MKITCTCIACPTQYDIDDLPMGMYGYFRYRFGHWQIDIAQSRAHWWEHEHLASMREPMGEPLDGSLEEGEVFALLGTYLPELLEQALTALSQQSNVLLSTTTDRN